MFFLVQFCLSFFEMEQYDLKLDFWNVNRLLDEKASDDFLQNEIRKHETWQ